MTPISDRVPPGVRAILDALRFDRQPAAIPDLSPADLAFADRSLLTPLLSRFQLPPVVDPRADPCVQSHIDGALARNTIRVERISAAYAEIAGRFDHVVLKGFTHVPDQRGRHPDQPGQGRNDFSPVGNLAGDKNRAQRHERPARLIACPTNMGR